MKKFFNPFIATFFIMLLVIIYSCGTKDKCEGVTCGIDQICIDGSCVDTNKCKNVNCGANGICDNGNCICDAGYEGTNCEKISRDKFSGVWTVKTAKCAIDNCGTIVPQDDQNCPINYKVTFGAGSTITKFTASNWASFGAIGTGTFNASTNTMTFDTMTVTSGTQVSKVIGNGIYSADSIKLNYTIISGCVKVTAQEVLKK